MDIEEFAEIQVPQDGGEETEREVQIHSQRPIVKLPKAPESFVPGGGKTVYIKSWGCGHNTSDGEVMGGLLQTAGYNVTEDFEDPQIDCYVLNSCTVKNPSETTFRNLVAKSKESGKSVVVSGCVPQADNKKDQWSDVSVIGVQQIDRVVQVVEQSLQGNIVHVLARSKKDKPSLNLPKIRRNKFIEIIPINLGCLGDCTYCKTKFARGSLVSYPIAEIVERAKACIEEGVVEIRLTS